MEPDGPACRVGRGPETKGALVYGKNAAQLRGSDRGSQHPGGSAGRGRPPCAEGFSPGRAHGAGGRRKSRMADGTCCRCRAGACGRRCGCDQIRPCKREDPRCDLLRGRPPGAGCQQLCRHPEGAGAGAGPAARGHGAVPAFRRWKCTV